MGKPSIFSKEYEKKMKRRRIRNFILVVVCVLVVCSIAFKEVLGNSFNSINVSIRNVFTKSEVNKDAKKTNEEVKQEGNEAKKEETKETAKETVKEEKKEESVEVQIGNGAKVLVSYELKNGEKNFSSINPGNSVVSYSISPSNKKVVIFDEKNQNIYLVNENKEYKDISMKKYTTSSGDFTIDKNTQLTTNPSYIWHSLPKFVDEAHVAYMSQLPWLNKEDKYLWILDLNNLSYAVNYNIQGKISGLGNLVDKGLEVKLDNGETKYLQPNGTIQ